MKGWFTRYDWIYLRYGPTFGSGDIIGTNTKADRGAGGGRGVGGGL